MSTEWIVYLLGCLVAGVAFFVWNYYFEGERKFHSVWYMIYQSLKAAVTSWIGIIFVFLFGVCALLARLDDYITYKIDKN